MSFDWNKLYTFARLSFNSFWFSELVKFIVNHWKRFLRKFQFNMNSCVELRDCYKYWTQVAKLKDTFCKWLIFFLFHVIKIDILSSSVFPF